jgi:HAD superfamily hydrolase (TIGR01549 family)
MQNKITAVLFDLGETILNFGVLPESPKAAKLFVRSARDSYNYLKHTGQPVGSFLLYKIESLLKLRLHRWISNITRNDFDSLELLKKKGIKKGFTLSQQQWEEFAWLWYRPLRDTASIDHGTPQALRRLKEELRLELGILSNTFVHASSLERHLAEEGILQFFTTRLYSYQFDFRKPDPRIFREAARQMHRPLQNIIYVGDRIDCDIQPALQLGMTACLKAAPTNHGQNLPQGAFKITSITELPDLIKQHQLAESTKTTREA